MKKNTLFGRKYPIIKCEVYEAWKRVLYIKNIPFDEISVKRINALAKKYGIRIK